MTAFLFLALSCWEQTASAYLFSQAGVESNFLIHDGRVLFAQADGSLTALSLEKGDVLVRSASRYYTGTLQRVPAGILVLAYNSITLLRADSLTPVWETKCSYQPNVTADSLVSYDGNDRVECRALTDATVCWSYSLPGALQVIAQSGRILVHRAATYEKTPTTTVLLDLENGRELFRKTPPPGVHWNNVFFDGTNVYVQAGPFQRQRSDYQLQHLAVWNLRGEQTALLPIPAETRSNPKFIADDFDLDGKTFREGRVYANRRSIPSERLGILVAASEQTIGGTDIGETEYELGEGLRWVQRMSGRSGPGADAQAEYELRSPQRSWRGSLPYLAKRGHIAAMTAAQGRILLGSNLGHVECLDAATGKSLWLYVFPTVRQTVSFSSPHGLPPMMADAAANFRRDNRIIPHTGFQLAGAPPSSPRVIRDPKPWNPFADLPALLALTWGCAAAALAVLLTLHLHPKWRRANVQLLGLISAAFTILSLACFIRLGRVSLTGYIGLQLAILAGLVFGLRNALECCRQHHWICGLILTPLFLAIAVLILSVYAPVLNF